MSVPRVSLVVAGLLAVAFVGGASWSALKLWPYADLRNIAVQWLRAETPASRKIVTNFATLDLTSWPVEPPLAIAHPGGGIDAVGDDVLIMSFRGEFFVYRHGGPQRLRPLQVRTDNGYERYRRYLAANAIEYPNTDTYFRFIDVAYDDTGKAPVLWVSHHQWHDLEACYTVRLSKLVLAPALPLAEQSASSEDWTRAYDTVPCLRIDGSARAFQGHQSGGRLVVLGPDTVLMSVGDHGYDGWSHERMLPQDPASDYGKILLVHPESGTAQHVSLGHRNPQGLTVSNDGLIWSTEHGPNGGDELNLIVDGGNYGWPWVTYGAQYGRSSWPMSSTQNRHEEYRRPVFAWLPSIGVSSLIQVRGFLPEWDGDLLLASMADKTLHRIRYSDGRVIFDEPIQVGERIRDIDQLGDGTLVLWTDDAKILELRPGQSLEPDLGRIVANLPAPLRSRAVGTISTCLECHDASPGANAAGAPNLWGVYGRQIAAADFAGYSDALKSRTGRWDEAVLNDFLSDVQTFAPGSTMGLSGIPDADVRAVIIDYLKALRRDEEVGSGGA